MDRDEVRELLRDLKAPDEAMAAFPDECANCGVQADSFFVPNDYHEQSDGERDPGVCTECGHHFGSGKPL